MREGEGEGRPHPRGRAFAVQSPPPGNPITWSVTQRERAALRLGGNFYDYLR